MEPSLGIRLSKEQISYYRLDQNEMGYQEKEDFAVARLLGISREDYMVRMQHYNELKRLTPCPPVIESQNGYDFHLYAECDDARRKALGLR